jgi:hypothetical protein
VLLKSGVNLGTAVKILMFFVFTHQTVETGRSPVSGGALAYGWSADDDPAKNLARE